MTRHLPAADPSTRAATPPSHHTMTETLPPPNPSATSEPRPHPATYSASVLAAIGQAWDDHLGRATGESAVVLDPFAGIGKLARYARETYPGEVEVVGVELEPEWACQDPQTRVGDALALEFDDDTFDAITTSPCYGNRMADHHQARDDSERHTYTHKLGRLPSPGSSTVMHWGPAYREFHQAAWREARRVLRPSTEDRPTVAVLNVSNHLATVKGRQVEQRVAEWHLSDWLAAGCYLLEVVRVDTRRQRHGQNGEARVACEFLLVLAMPTTKGML